MSVYSLETQQAFNYYVKHRANLLYLSDREYANTYFKIGEKINKKEQMFSQVMVEILCTENCEIINYINDKLNGILPIECEPIKKEHIKDCRDDKECKDTWNSTQW